MLLVQQIGRPSDVKNCADLAPYFIGKVEELVGAYDEIHSILDRYNIDNSLKAATRELRQGFPFSCLVFKSLCKQNCTCKQNGLSCTEMWNR